MIDKERALQALVRFARTIGAFAVALVLEGLADWIGLFNLSPELVLLITPILTAILNAIGKFLRGEDVPVAAATERQLGRARSVPIREYRKAFFLPI